MSQGNSRLGAFEARLAELRRQMEAGLDARADNLQQHLGELVTSEASGRDGLRVQAHKLRGVAGTHGYSALSRLAGTVEDLALSAPLPDLQQVATELIAAVREIAATTAVAPFSTVGPSVPPAGPPPQRRVLAIDDDPETRSLLDLTLRKLGGWQTVIVDTAEGALVHLAQEHFDVVLCDAMMPDMNGLAFCARASQLPAPLPPIVILSAATAEELGWNLNVPHAPRAWWRKPFRPKALVASVREVLGDTVLPVTS